MFKKLKTEWKLLIKPNNKEVITNTLIITGITIIVSSIITGLNILFSYIQF